VVEVQVGGLRSQGQELQPGDGQLVALGDPAAQVGDGGELLAQLRLERPVVDRGGRGVPRADQFLGGVGVAEPVRGDAHQAVQAAEQEMQVGLLARPQPPVQQPVDPVADPAQVQEYRKRRAGIAQPGQAYHVRAELLERGLAYAVLLVVLGVVASLVRCHQHLSLDSQTPRKGLLTSEVSDDGRCWQVGGGRTDSRGGSLAVCRQGRQGRGERQGRARRRCVRCLPAVTGPELAGLDAERTAVVELVAFGDAALAFPAVDVVQHAAGAGHGLVAGLAPGLDESAGHRGLGPAPFLALLAQPRCEFGVHRGSVPPGWVSCG
jgi:hypothetical protein